MKKIDRYCVVERLGTSVFLVENGRRRAALKMLSGGTDEHDLDLVSRCFTTACAASALRHHGIARVYDVGLTATAEPFVVSELVEGESLTRVLARGPLPLRRAMRIARRIAVALAAAHDAGIAHGSLDPDNIIVDGERVKLINFGIAHLGGGPALACLDRLHPPLYTSPEQCRATSTFDERSDLYTFGCLVFALIAGKPPFATTNIGQLWMSHLMATPPRLDAPIEIRSLVDDLLAKHPGDRPSAAYCVAVFDGQLREVATPAVVALRWVAALALVASLAFTTAYAARVQFAEKTHAVFHDLEQRSLPR